MKRGEIYIIRRRDTIGAEIMKARPGVVVSNDALNATSGTVCVVYLTTQPKKDLPTHACINATGLPSMALCEQIDSVSVKLIGERVGVCSEKEMEAIDRCLLQTLGLNGAKTGPELSKGEQWLMTELAKMQAERDRYAKMIDLLLGEAKA